MGIGQLPELRRMIVCMYLFSVNDGLSGGGCALHFVGAAARMRGGMNKCWLRRRNGRSATSVQVT